MILTEFTSNVFRPGPKLPVNAPDQKIRLVDKFYGELYREGDELNELFFLIQGKVLLTKRNEWGRKVRLPSIRKGSFLGLQGLQHAGVSSHSAKICQPSRLLIIPLVNLPDFINRWPELKEQIIAQLISHLDLLQLH